MKRFKTLISYTLYTLLALVLFTSCSGDIKEVKSGEMKHIPFSKNYAIGTDSTIVIIDRVSGKTLNVINRESK